MKFEILAPAGNMESLKAGVRCGANAVYLAGQTLNARRNAGNFNDEQLHEAVSYCHRRGVKVYYALNILIQDNEMTDALNVVRHALVAGVDAFIIQDFGLASLLLKRFPFINLHASTQMSVLSDVGFKALEEAGFRRAVLPREAAKEEIKAIRASTSIELEAFVHGAHCMCVSGQCYLSAMIGSRSGNRGLCAQPCRLPFSADASGNWDLSLKDLSLIHLLSELHESGVFSLKIEGRMKRPEYVAGAVNAVKKAIHSSYSVEDERKLRAVFSRSGFSDGYFRNARGESMFGTRQKEDVTAAKEVLSEFQCLYDNETPLISVDFDFVCKKEVPVILRAKALENAVCVSGAVPETAINKPMTAEAIKARLSKLGGTPYYAGRVDVTLDDSLILPVSEINRLRREAAEALFQPEIVHIEENPYQPASPCQKEAIPYFTARFQSPNQIPEKHSFSRIFLPLSTTPEAFTKHGAGVEFPRGIFGSFQKIREKLVMLKSIGVKNALCPSLDAYSIAKEIGFEVYADFSLNIMNSQTAQMFDHPMLSFELTLSQANQINAKDTGVIVYGRLPLMLMRNCPIKNRTDCVSCKGNSTLTDRTGRRFSIVCSESICVELLNCVPVYMGDRMREVKTDFAHFYFTAETKEEVAQIATLFKKGAPPPFDYTRGLYQRGTL